MKTQKVLLIGCGVAAAIGLLGLVCVDGCENVQFLTQVADTMVE